MDKEQRLALFSNDQAPKMSSQESQNDANSAESHEICLSEHAQDGVNTESSNASRESVDEEPPDK